MEASGGLIECVSRETGIIQGAVFHVKHTDFFTARAAIGILLAPGSHHVLTRRIFCNLLIYKGLY
jgi:hypothetical protein